MMVTPDSTGAVARTETETVLKLAVRSGEALEIETLSPSPDSQADSRKTADFNGDGRVNFADLLLFAGAFGGTHDTPGFDGRFDLNGDQEVGFEDFLVFASAFGR
jgi:hypothetical protein